MLRFLWLSSVLDTVRLAPSTLTTMLSRLSNVAPSQSPSRHVTLPPRGSGRLWEQARRSGGTMTEASRDAEAHATLTTAVVHEPCHLPIPFVKGTEHGASVRSVDLTSSSAEMPVARRRFLLVSWGTSAGPTAHRLAQVGARRSFVQRSGVGFVAQRALAVRWQSCESC